MTPLGSLGLNFHGMATLTSIDAVRRKIQNLQQQAYEAEDRAELFQTEADMERQARERVTIRTGPSGLQGALLGHWPIYSPLGLRAKIIFNLIINKFNLNGLTNLTLSFSS